MKTKPVGGVRGQSLRVGIWQQIPSFSTLPSGADHPENLIRPEKLYLQNSWIEITMTTGQFFDSVLRTLRFGTWVKA